jgi:cobalt-zinc-cadmium efflux system membrane fusion protein
MYITPSDVIIEIVDPGHFHLELSVFEKDVLKIKEGQDILFRIPEAGQILYKGEVILVGKSVEGEERAVKIHGHLAGDEKINFVTGMFVEADILIGKRKSHGLPSEAVLNMGNDHFIFIKTFEEGEKMFFVRRKVEIGQISETLTEILGDHDTSNILIKGAFNLSRDR